jgi:hypothetical protein
MAYREHPIGVNIRTNPGAAFSELQDMLRSDRICGNIAKLAEYYDVDYRTAARWILRLAAKQFDLSKTIIQAKADAKKNNLRIYRDLKSRS